MKHNLDKIFNIFVVGFTVACICCMYYRYGICLKALPSTISLVVLNLCSCAQLLILDK